MSINTSAISLNIFKACTTIALIIASSYAHSQGMILDKGSHCNPSSGGVSNNCSIDVSCPEGIPWIHEQNSAVWNSSSVDAPMGWSAAFINNVHEDTTKYVIMAAHVDGDLAGVNPQASAAASRWLRVNYRFTSCSGSTIDNYYFIQATWVTCASGCVWNPQINNCTATPDRDYTLARIISPISNDVPIYYSGWSSDPNMSYDPGAVIGHPCGDCQKITPVTDIVDNGNQIAFEYQTGNIQEGNSGSPSYNAEHELIAVAARAGCQNPADPKTCNGLGCASSENPKYVKGPSLEYNWTFGGTWLGFDLTLEGQLARGTSIRSMPPIAGYDFEIDNLIFSDPTTDYGRGFFRTIGDINAENISVQSGGNLQLLARGSVLIDGPFEAEVGSTLLVKPVPPVPSNFAHETCYPLSGSRTGDPNSSNTNTAELSLEQMYPDITQLGNAYPNPFARETRFQLNLSESKRVTITILDIRGREIATIMDGEYMPAGNATIIWYGQDSSGNPVASGTYLYRMVAGDDVQSGTVTVIR